MQLALLSRDGGVTTSIPEDISQQGRLGAWGDRWAGRVWMAIAVKVKLKLDTQALSVTWVPTTSSVDSLKSRVCWGQRTLWEWLDRASAKPQGDQSRDLIWIHSTQCPEHGGPSSRHSPASQSQVLGNLQRTGANTTPGEDVAQHQGKGTQPHACWVPQKSPTA